MGHWVQQDKTLDFRPKHDRFESCLGHAVFKCVVFFTDQCLLFQIPLPSRKKGHCKNIFTFITYNEKSKNNKKFKNEMALKK